MRPLGGGPEDLEPPRLNQVSPADSSTGIPRLPVFELTFDEKLSPRSREAVRLYPAVRHREVKVKGERLRIAVFDTLPADTTLILVLGKTLRDEEPRTNQSKRESWLLFATGPSLHAAGVAGRVAVKGKPNDKAAVEFVPLRVDSVGGRPAAYPVAATDEEGLFRMMGIPPGRPFLLRAFADRNDNLRFDDGELHEMRPDTLLLADGEVRRSLQWNLIDPNEPSRITGLVANETRLEGRLAVAAQTLQPSRPDTARTDSLAVVRADTLSPLPLPVPPRAESGWESAYAQLEPRGFVRPEWQVVYASERGQYSVHVRAGELRLLAFVDVSGDSVPGLFVLPDSTGLAWEPLWVGEFYPVAPGAESSRNIAIEPPPGWSPPH